MSDLHELLASDHARLETIFAELENAAEAGDQPTLQRAYDAFERGLLAHFDAEERFVFPLLERDHASEVARALHDHERVRALLAELGVRTDLHLLRKTVADELLCQLRAHADWEDRTLYAWADACVHGDTRRSLRETIAET